MVDKFGPSAISTIRMAPKEYICGFDAMAELGAVTGRYGRRPLVVGGLVGMPMVKDKAVASFKANGLPWRQTIIEGFCTQALIEGLGKEVAARNGDVVVGIGGGRVLDAAKAIAHFHRVPCIAVPTSPATCAAVRALTVLYSQDGEWQGGLTLNTPPEVCLVDLQVVGSAPRRLLAAGIVDGLVKWQELRFFHAKAGMLLPTMPAALALAEGFGVQMLRYSREAMAQARRGELGIERLLLAEAAVLVPGLVSGLAGGSNELAVAHEVHNALTLLRDSRHSLHGELVGFGLLVQLVLDSASEREVYEMAELLARLEQPMGLEALGCGAALVGAGTRVVDSLTSSTVIKKALGEFDAEEILAALVMADEVAISTGAAKASVKGEGPSA